MAARSPHMYVVRRLLLAQLSFAVFFPLVLLPFGMNAALSAAAGGFISFVPNSYFAYRTFQYSGARAAHEIVRSTFAGQRFYYGSVGNLANPVTGELET